jgi:hypothetical protein
MAEADLSKIVNLILQNPKLVEEIRGMAESSEDQNEIKASDTDTAKAGEALMPELKTAIPNEELTYPKNKRQRRQDLLRAIKPYVSEERSKAIESMITVADILLSIKEK